MPCFKDTSTVAAEGKETVAYPLSPPTCSSFWRFEPAIFWLQDQVCYLQSNYTHTHIWQSRRPALVYCSPSFRQLLCTRSSSSFLYRPFSLPRSLLPFCHPRPLCCSFHLTLQKKKRKKAMNSQGVLQLHLEWNYHSCL